MKVKIRYKCACLQDEVAIDIEARRPHQDIAEWMENVVTPALTKDHRQRSPICQATAVEYLKLAVPEDGRRIGDGNERLN